MRTFGELWRMAFTRWALLIVALVALFGWWLRLRPVAIVWGTVGEALGGVGTVVLLFFAAQELRLLRIDQKERAEAEDTRRSAAREASERERNEHREAMARAVGASATVQSIDGMLGRLRAWWAARGEGGFRGDLLPSPRDWWISRAARGELGEAEPWPVQRPEAPKPWLVKYRVYNGADYPISSAVLLVRDPGQHLPEWDCEASGVDDEVVPAPDPQQGNAMELVMGTVLARETQTGAMAVSFTAEPVFGELTNLVSLLFVDTWGQTWHSRDGAVERRDSPPRIC